MPTRSASGTPTLPIPLPTPSPPPFVTSPNNSYSSNESDDLDSPPCVPSKDNFNPMATISTMPTMLLSTNSDVGSTEEDERQFGTTGGIASSTSNPILPDWRLSILAQKEYSAAIHKYTEMQWESARVEIERNSALKVKARK